MTDPTVEIPADHLDDYPVAFIQHLIDNGDAWRQEGALGRAALKAIENGTCVLGAVAHRDWFGRVVPARGDLEAGAKGSLAYANALRAERGEPALVESEDGTISVGAAT